MPQSSEQRSMTMWEHLNELANRLKVIVIALLLASSISFLPADPKGFLDPINHYQPIISLIMLKIKRDFLPSGATLIASGLVDTIFVYMYLTILIGIVLAAPIIAYELYAYIRPALYPHERKYLVTFTGSFIGLFILGLLIAYFLIIPITFKILIWFITSGGAVPFIGIRDFYYWILTILLASGLFYTVPVLIVLLVQFGIIPAKFVSGKRKMIYVALLIILTIITPDPTPITATIIMIPFIIIFEGAAYASKRIDEGRLKSTPGSYGGAKYPLGSVACKFCGGNVSSSFCSVCGKSQI